MITFDLQCSNGHTFEGWFEDIKAYEEQKEKKLIACPVCSTASISRLPSTFMLKTSGGSRASFDPNSALMNIGKKIVEFVEKNFDDVGCNFASEALKIHYGTVEPRNIRGISTNEEEKILKEEGVQFFKIPKPTSSDNDA
ncbi:MAG: DUF1178 family protein [Desulfobacterales bacterium]|nr:DUF1178 family protein [Desulfobacterales bacterium]